MSASLDKTTPKVLVFSDSQSWVQTFIINTLKQLNIKFTPFHPGADLKTNYNQIKKHTHFIVSWESQYRFGGALIHNLTDIFTEINAREQVIILTQSPAKEDVIYFGELGIRKVLQVSQTGDLTLQVEKLGEFFHPKSQDQLSQWQALLSKIHTLPREINSNTIQEMLRLVDAFSPKDVEESAQKYNAKAKLYAALGDNELAEEFWKKALKKNPKYHLANSDYVNYLKQTGRFEEAIDHMLKLHQINSNNIARIVDIGDAHQQLEKIEEAEKYYQNALSKDKYCSGALNGLATIKFHQGNLDESKKLLQLSAKAYEAAAMLNHRGIELVMKDKFEEALDHYTRAQYVLPDHEKGPLLFYNMALCYWRWNQPEKAREYIQIALIKNPKYEKARILLDAIDAPSSQPAVQKSA